MQNYSQQFADALAEFVSPLCPAGTEDAAKGQVTARAGYAVQTTLNAHIGFIAKSGGQTQYPNPPPEGVVGIGVDALLDKSDATGADFLTDVDAGGGMREIRVAYTAYAPPPAGTVIPPTNWVQPTSAHLSYGGPLVLKSGTPEPPKPEPIPPTPVEPMPPMPTVWSSHEFLTLDWFSEMSPSLDAVYCNLFTAPGKPLRHADYGGWGNWQYHIVIGEQSVEWVVEQMKLSDEYKAIHGA